MLWSQKDIPGDVAGGYGVDKADFSEMSLTWLMQDGTSISDLLKLATYWLEGK